MLINPILLGAIAMACFVATLFFLRFWRMTHDRLFLFFAASFFLEGCCRVVLGMTTFSEEQEPFIYLLRLVSYLILFFGILDKNLRKQH